MRICLAKSLIILTQNRRNQGTAGQGFAPGVVPTSRSYEDVHLFQVIFGTKISGNGMYFSNKTSGFGI